MALTQRALGVKAESYTAREETLDGRQYLVVPVTMLVEGVVWASNASSPELVTMDAFKDAPVAFNGKPLFLDHPKRYGVPVAGSQPGVFEDNIGLVFNTYVDTEKRSLRCEAWVDVAKALARGKDGEELIDRIKAGEVIEISVGIAADEIAESGTFNGKRYADKWGPIAPDHLALLSVGSKGACSVAMGCGVRAAKGAEDVKHMYLEWLEEGPDTEELLKTLRDIPQSERDKMPEDDFAGPNRSFPIMMPEDVGAAAHSLGRAKGNRNSIKRRIISIAYRKGDEFVAQLPEDWKRKADQKNASLFQRVLSFFRIAQSADEMTDSDLRRKLFEALQEVEPNLIYVEAYHPVTDPTHVVYCVYVPSSDVGPEMGMGYQTEMYERAFTLSDSGVVTVNAARIEVTPVMSYEPAEGTSPKMAESHKDAEADAPCSCQNKAASTEPTAETVEEDSTMKFECVGKALEAKNPTPEQLAAVVTFINGDFKAAETVKEVTVEKEVVKEVPVEMTREQAIEKFGFGDAVKAAEKAKAKAIATIKANKANTFTDEQLNAKSQDELDQIVSLAAANVSATSVKAATDFAGRGGAKEEGSEEEGAPAVPSLDERIKANRAKR